MTITYVRDNEGKVITQTMPLYQMIAQALTAYHNCIQSNNTEWRDKHADRIAECVNLLPSGSGIDSGTTFDNSLSSDKKLVFSCGYHHMNEGGCYDGWTEHTIIVTPAFNGIDIRITGRNRNDIKDYLHEVYDYALNQLVDWSADGIRPHLSPEDNATIDNLLGPAKGGDA